MDKTKMYNSVVTFAVICNLDGFCHYQCWELTDFVRIHSVKIIKS